MEKFIVLVNCFGDMMCGSDGIMYIDGRRGKKRIQKEANELRERYKKSFRSKYESWKGYKLLRDLSQDEKPLTMYNF